jgi:hypothetical protein
VTEPLELLARPDKWFLSAGEGLIWAPPHPAWLDGPGFWDEAHLFGLPLAPVFTVTFVDEAGRVLQLTPRARRWTPASLEVPYGTAVGVDAVEARMVLPGLVLGSEWQLHNVGLTPMRLHAVAWTTAPGEEVGADDVQWSGVELAWPRRLSTAELGTLPVRLQLAMARGTDSWAAARSESAANLPSFTITPFWDRWDPTRGGLSGRADLGAAAERGLVYLAVHRSIEVPPGAAARLAVALRVLPQLERNAEAPPGGPGPRASSFAAASRASWEEYFGGLPVFRCADPYFERYWVYRWYGLRLARLLPGWGGQLSPTVAEGVGPLHRPAALSAPGQVRELRWLRDPEWARGVLRTFTRRQRPDGSLPARVGLLDVDDGRLLLADWGDALVALDAVHPDDGFLREVLPCFARYAEWLVSARDREGAGLLDVCDWNEAGQPFGPRFRGQVGEQLDLEKSARIKGVDATVYAHNLFRALALLGPRAGLDPTAWSQRAEQTASAARRRLWDGKSLMFADLNPASGRRTSARSVVAFLPYRTDIVAVEHLAGFVQNLFDPRQFWKPFPVPSVSGTDASYDPDASWQGTRRGRAWNGRVWPIANSQIAEAIALVATQHVPALRAHLVEFVTKYVRMLFWDGDASRPNSFEHYHPVTGRPSAYRGLDDHLQGWVNDLLVQYVVGLRPDGEGRCVVDPMPFPLDGFEARGLAMQGAAVDVEREDQRLVVRVNGREAARGRLGEPIRIAL